MKCEKSGNHTISYQSLLLSTTVLNDNIDNIVNHNLRRNKLNGCSQQENLHAVS